MSERRIVVILFVLVFVAFSFAHEDSKKLEEIYSSYKTTLTAEPTASQKSEIPEVNKIEGHSYKEVPAP